MMKLKTRYQEANAGSQADREVGPCNLELEHHGEWIDNRRGVEELREHRVLLRRCRLLMPLDVELHRVRVVVRAVGELDIRLQLERPLSEVTVGVQ